MNARRRLLQAVLGSAFVRVARAAGSPGTPDLPSPARAPNESITPVVIGDTQVELYTRRFGSGGWRYLNLHENERTSVEAARLLLQSEPGTLIGLRSRGSRLVTFHDGGRPYTFDPNRIFSDDGLERTMRHYASYASKAAEAVRGLRAAILAAIAGPPEDRIVALHNNYGGGFSIHRYAQAGTQSADARAVAMPSGHEPEDFFLVTRPRDFEALRDAGFNVVLQAEHPADDGSLSVWAQREGRAYVNVEARHGRLQTQLRMLRAVAALARM